MNNINETNQISNNNSKVININNVKHNSADFSYYVEVTNAQNTITEFQENQNDNNNENQEQDISLQNDTNTNICIQTFQALNNEIFDMGLINDNESKQNFLNDDFKYNFDLSDMTMNDIKLFQGLTQNSTDLAVNSFNPDNQTFNMLINGENVDISYRSMEVSKTLFTALENAAKTGKSVRLDFGSDTSVILKIGKDGKLSADFIPNEKAMEAVLKNALPQLKAKLEEENLPYGELNYRNFNQQKENQNQKQKQNKENNKDE